jgi:ADP-ribosyl-[dinitrogen reductase] hydrolase
VFIIHQHHPSPITHHRLGANPSSLIPNTMLGAIIGDMVGSIYEFNNHRSKEFPFFGAATDFTDDTICTIAVADALLHDIHPAEALHDWCGRYPNRGYGRSFRRWLDTGDRQPYGSYGNGAAMRVSPTGLLGRTLEEALAMARKVTEVTHNHPEGLKGATATAHAIFLARAKDTPDRIRAVIESTYGYDLARTVDGIRPNYYFNETCQETVPEPLCVHSRQATSRTPSATRSRSAGIRTRWPRSRAGWRTRSSAFRTSWPKAAWRGCRRR